MKVMSNSTKFAHLGKPGSIFSKGFERRLKKILGLVDLKDKKILDLGAGEGVWMIRFAEFTSPENIYGVDYDAESLKKFEANNNKSKVKISTNNFKIGPAESLDFPDSFFDVVFQNEVLEHVENDVKTIEECLRVLKNGGHLIIFTPNTLWPFEQHGIFVGKKYIWGNIPLLPWLPKFIKKKFAPHVRNYSCRDLNKVFEKASLNTQINYHVVYHKHVFPGFDGLERRYGAIGKIIKKIFHKLEKTPLGIFGISHLVIIEKDSE
ncbi:MAG: hypothetical protein KatS3mg085_546 [Candidatus Dojkabacteria bacterium]|nr:MAG: hypothetical protein KatS3mg085_546 [Candidatus Dojkabacteria bacterium]